MRVLVACEHSGAVRDAFRALGHDAWSCDLLPDVGGSPFHIESDALKAVANGWELLIAHPPCTYLTGSAEWAYGNGPYHQKVKPGTLTGAERRTAREEAAAFFMALANAPVDRIAIENPVGCMSRIYRKPDQIVQPYEFGADASKRTCLWLKGLPRLAPTQYVAPRIANGRPRWANQTDSGQNRLSPCDDRWKARSLTYPGIAKAMAAQWGEQTFSLAA